MITSVLNPRNLTKAREKVISNRGSSGIDKMSVKELRVFDQKYRKTLTKSIQKGKYSVSAIRGVEIPKGKGKTRMLGVPTVVDRMLQQAVSQVLTNYFEPTFEESSYGFRPKKNLQQAVLKSQEYINEGYQNIVDIDLKTFFDEVAHYQLLQLIYNKVKCQTTLKLIRKWLRAPIAIKGRLHKRRKGIPQGSPLSPLLANILLDQLDKYLKEKGVKYLRYADDFSIYCKTKVEAKRVGNEVYQYLRDKLKLSINRAKSGIRRPINFKLLGHGFVPSYKKGAKGNYQIVAKKASWETLKRKLKYATKKTLPKSLPERIAELKLIYRGWINNFRLGNIKGKLKKVEEWVRNRLRYCIWHDWKKLERKRKNLIRLGIDQDMAYAWSRTRMGGWAVAQSPILRTTITIERLKKKGYESMVEYYHRVKS